MSVVLLRSLPIAVGLARGPGAVVARHRTRRPADLAALAGGRAAVATVSTLLAASLLGGGCATAVVPDGGPRAYYQTAYPIRDTSGQLAAVLEAVRRAHISADYVTYHFAVEQAPAGDEPITEAVLALAVDTAGTEVNRASSAVVVSRRGTNVLLVAARHAVHLPDTIVQYFGREPAVPGIRVSDRRVRSVSVLVRSSRWVDGLPSLRPFELLAEDASNDLALIGVRYSDTRQAGSVAVLPVPAGRSSRLSWGSFVYSVGYPAGTAMVTRGIVSNPGGPSGRAFVIDGLWNEGMSGGLVLAVRGSGEQLEWVGMARASGGSTEYRLAPLQDAEQTHEDWQPYQGPIFIQEVRRIQYGITFAVPVDLIRSFVNEHRGTLRDRGYEVPRL